MLLCNLVGVGDARGPHSLRERIVEHEPAVIAYGLRGVRTPESMDLRRQLQESQPHYVARSIAGIREVPEVDTMRDALADFAPDFVRSQRAWPRYRGCLGAT